MRTSKTREILRYVMDYAISISIFILIWSLYVNISGVPQFVLPKPTVVFKEFIGLFTTGMIWPHLGMTVFEVVIGFGIGVIGGIALGYLVAKIEVVKTALMPFIIFIQTAPKIALVPLFVVWFGIGLPSKIVLIVSMVIFPIMSGIILGIDSIPADARNLMRILKANKLQVFMHLEIKYSLPMLFSGLKIGIVQAVIGAIVAEWMSGKIGLGYILTYGNATYDTPLLMAGIIVTIILGIVSYESIELIGRKLLKWHVSQNIE